MKKETASPRIEVHAQVARITKALSSPKRLELLEMLAQGEKTVEVLAGQLGIDIRLASAHLRALREACLVRSRRAGKYIHYRLSGPDVAEIGVRLRELATEHLLEMRLAAAELLSDASLFSVSSRSELLKKARDGEVVVLDVRPADEFASGHLPHAVSIPLDQLESRLAELSKRRTVIAYCRGPYCVLSTEAVRVLRAHGFKARKILDGVTEWRDAGLPTEHGAP